MYNQSFFNTVRGQNLLESISNSLKRIADGIQKRNELSEKLVKSNECASIPDEESLIQKTYFDDEGKLKVRLIAAEICEEFEEFLDENGHIMIPDSQREGNEDEALLYGETYNAVEDEVSSKLSEFFNTVIYEGLATAKIGEVSKEIFWNVFMPIYENNGGQKEKYNFYLSVGNRYKNIYDLICKIAHYLIDIADEESEDFCFELNKEEY